MVYFRFFEMVWAHLGYTWTHSRGDHLQVVVIVQVVVWMSSPGRLRATDHRYSPPKRLGPTLSICL